MRVVVKRVDQFPAASELVNELMALVMAEVQRVPTLKLKLFQVIY